MDLRKVGERRAIISEIKGDENNDRLENSLKEWEIYNGQIRDYVYNSICERFSRNTADNTPIVSSINVLKKSVDTRSGLYKEPPRRVYTNVSEEAKEVLDLIYRDMGANSKLADSNKLFELQTQQTHALIEPKNGRMSLRPLKKHQVNVIPDPVDNEKAGVYILSAFNKNDSRLTGVRGDAVNQKIADVNDTNVNNERYIVWSKEFHFVMNGKGEIVDSEGNLLLDIEDDSLIENPIAPLMPIVEFSAMKDFDYWRSGSTELADFTLFINEGFSMCGSVVENQGFAQAVMWGPQEMMQEEIFVGPRRILKLITDPNRPDEKIDFDYKNPSSDISGVLDYYSKLIMMFLSSQGLDPNTVAGQPNSTSNFSSATERLLALIEKFDASKEAMDVYKVGERKIFEIIKAWLSAYSDSDDLDPKYKISIPDSAELVIKFKEPQSLLTESEKMDIAERRIDNKLWSRQDALVFLDDVPKEEAAKQVKEVDKVNVETLPLFPSKENEENSDR